jgi:hypothetical protein
MEKCLEDIKKLDGIKEAILCHSSPHGSGDEHESIKRKRRKKTVFFLPM